MRTYWKRFIYGGILKLLGDCCALIGPISISRIVEYIQQNLSVASSLLTIANTTSPLKNVKLSNAINGTDATASITHSDVTSTTAMAAALVLNDAIKTRSNSNVSNYYVPLSAAELSSLSLGQWMSSAQLINENTEIYYPSWPEFVENGWIMALLVLLATLAQGTFSQASTHIANMIGIRLRTSLQVLVYRKTLLISSSCFIAPNSFDCNESNTNQRYIDTENSNGSTAADTHETNYCTNNKTTTSDNSNGNDNYNNDNGNHRTDNERVAAATTAASASPMDDKTNTDSMDTDNKSAQQRFHEQTPIIDTGTITNLMSEDALNVMSFFYICHYVWAIPLKVGSYFFDSC